MRERERELKRMCVYVCEEWAEHELCCPGMCVCARVCAHVCVCTCVIVCLCLCLSIHIYAYTKHIYIFIYIYI